MPTKQAARERPEALIIDRPCNKVSHIQSAIGSRVMCQPGASRRSARANNATLLARVAEVQNLVSNSCSNQEEMLHLIRHQRKSSEDQAQKLDDVKQQLVEQDTSSRNILVVAGEALSAILQVKDLLVQFSQDAINIQVIFNSMHLRSMDPNKELPAIIEDALGRQIPIPPEWLDSLDWDNVLCIFAYEEA
ncbi:hypothetical protein N0V84_003873 [Fusarium piperis]|uniref:Uncharacterized protein n=1 Tax=Fusarium piperis TaxID=1435070 RepID=A0A9W8WGN2_9HYPO|nr:hypothetical protein N0V84_003873 [Fusarium piperis]